MLLDTRGMRCPLPLLKLKQALHGLPAGAELTVLATDHGAKRDFPVFLAQAGHQLLTQEESEDGLRFIVRKRQ